MFWSAVALMWGVLNTSGTEILDRKGYEVGSPSEDEKARISNSIAHDEEQEIDDQDKSFQIFLNFINNASNIVSQGNCFVNVFGNNDRYSSKPVQLGAGGYWSPDASTFYQIDQTGASNSVPLTNGTPMSVTVIGKNSNVVYRCVPPLDYNADPENDPHVHTVTNLEAMAVSNAGPNSDSDGLSDAFEQYISNTATNNPDSDGDGQSDAYEQFMGSNPNASNEVYSFQVYFGQENGTNSISADVVSNVIYKTMRKLDLMTNIWDDVGQKTATKYGLEVIHTEPSAEKAFYKALADISNKVAE